MDSRLLLEPAEKDNKFNCIGCGSCCPPECLHYNKYTRSCNNYENRPVICRVDVFGETKEQTKIRREQSKLICHSLRNRLSSESTPPTKG